MDVRPGTFQDPECPERNFSQDGVDGEGVGNPTNNAMNLLVKEDNTLNK